MSAAPPNTPPAIAASLPENRPRTERPPGPPADAPSAATSAPSSTDASSARRLIASSLLRRQCAATVPVVGGQRVVGGGDRRQRGGDAGHVAPGDDDVELVIAEVGVDAVADAPRAGDGAARQRGGQCQARRAAEEARLR